MQLLQHLARSSGVWVSELRNVLRKSLSNAGALLKQLVCVMLICFHQSATATANTRIWKTHKHVHAHAHARTHARKHK